MLIMLIIFVISDFIARYGKMNERTARQKFWQILSAVEYCHNRNIVHRDLKVRVTCVHDMYGVHQNKYIYLHLNWTIEFEFTFHSI